MIPIQMIKKWYLGEGALENEVPRVKMRYGWEISWKGSEHEDGTSQETDGIAKQPLKSKMTGM